MNRIDKKFAELKNKNEKAMIPFIVAGDPDLAMTIELVLAMEQAGADIIELGIPYLDPIADGVIIQQASIRAVNSGTKITDIMQAVSAIRKKSQVPLVFLTYYNSIFKYGMERFIRECRNVGVDGIIIPDLPIEERKDITDTADQYEVYLIPLVAPTSRERIEKITQNGKGFVYCVSTNGVTGIRNKIGTDIKSYMDTVTLYTNMPKALGFGISSPEMARSYKDYCDAIIVGSAVVKKIHEAMDKQEALVNTAKFISEIKNTLR